MKKFFFDCETTGVDTKLCAIRQLSGAIEIDDAVVEVFDLKIRPFKEALFEDKAVEMSGMTVEEIMAEKRGYDTAYSDLIEILSRYVDRYDKTDKFFLAGYNSAKFDEDMLRNLFRIGGRDEYFGSWFFSGSLDVMCLAAEYLQKRRHRMPNFKLSTVATTLGIIVDEAKTHEALYDVGLTREIYKIVTGRKDEI